MTQWISKEQLIDAIDSVNWYHINGKGELVHGANGKDYVPLYYAKDIYKAINDLPYMDLPETEPCEDCISREETLKKFKDTYFDNKTVIRCAELVLGCMPSVTPKGGKKK